MGFPKWLVGGLIGTAIGVAVWVAVGYFLEAEVGYIAWGIGLLAGIGVRAAAQEDSGFLPGGIALICAVIGIVAAKYLVVTLLVDHAMADGGFGTVTETDLVVDFADDIALAREEAGQTVAWPAGMTYEDAAEQADYPPEIWAEAAPKFDALPAEERQQMISERQLLMDAFAESMGGAAKELAFKDSFSPFDFLWLGLAAFTAFKVGNGED